MGIGAVLRGPGKVVVVEGMMDELWVLGLLSLRCLCCIYMEKSVCYLLIKMCFHPTRRGEGKRKYYDFACNWT